MSIRTWRVLFRVDNLGHQYLGDLHKPLMGYLCDRLDFEVTRSPGESFKAWRAAQR